jgi:hypothetical protein
MLSKEKRIVYFLLGCIGVRTILAISPLYLDKSLFYMLGTITMIIGTSFLYLYFFNGRMNAPEGGGVTWWANYRLIHGLLYICASIYLFQKKRLAWLPLTIDVLLGLILFIINHSN